MTSGWIRRIAVLAVAGACALAAAGCSSSTQDAATIEYKDTPTKHISQKDLVEQIDELQSTKGFNDLIADNPELKGGKNDETANAKLTAQWLNVLIRQAVVDDEFNKQHLTVTDAQRQAALQSVQQTYTNPKNKDDIFSKLPKKLQDQLVDQQARTAAVLESCPSGRLVEHILVHTEAEATDLYNQIKKGADFGKLAKAKSIDTGSAQLNGVLGCLASGAYVPEFQKVAETIPLDTVSTPVKTQFGYHLILDRKWDPSFASNQQIAQSVQQAAGKVLNDRLGALKVHVDPRFGTWKSPEQGAGPEVVPPGVPEPNGFEPTSTTAPQAPLGLPAQGG